MARAKRNRPPRTNRNIHVNQSAKERIREAAAALMVRHGYVGTTISAISRRSGLPVTSLYWHFGSKEELLIAIAKEGTALWLSSIPDWEDFKGSTSQRLDQMMQAWATQCIEHPQAVKLLMILYLERDNLSSRAARVIHDSRQAAVNKLLPAMVAFVETEGGSLDPEFEAEELSNFCLSFMNGCFVDHHIAPETADLERRFFQLGLLLPTAFQGIHHDKRKPGSIVKSKLPKDQLRRKSELN